MPETRRAGSWINPGNSPNLTPETLEKLLLDIYNYEPNYSLDLSYPPGLISQIENMYKQNKSQGN